MGACIRGEDPVAGAAHRGRATVEDVRMDHRRGDVAVPEEFLNRADVVPVFEQVGRERVPNGVVLWERTCARESPRAAAGGRSR